MKPSELTATISSLAIIISECIPEDEELIKLIIVLDLLKDNLDGLLAQRKLFNLKK